MSLSPTVSRSGGDSPGLATEQVVTSTISHIASQPSRDSADSHPTDDAQQHNATGHGDAMVQSDPTRLRDVFAEQTPRTQCIVRALNARKEVLERH